MRPALPALLVAVFAAGLLIFVTSCGGNDENGGGSLQGTDRTLVSGVEAPSGALQTLSFDGERAGGSAGCNSFGFDHELDGRSIAIGEDFVATTMGCADPELERAEEAYVSVFAEVDGWAIEDGELVLSAGGEEVLRYAAATDP